MRALLDVNVLIALLDGDHLHHARAREWLAGHRHGWASCPLTQNGCVRILSQPTYPNVVPTAAALERLAEATQHPSHAFWSDDISVLDSDVVDGRRIHGPRQITDVYLLALAVRNGGTFATLDERVSSDAVRGAQPKHLTMI